MRERLKFALIGLGAGLLAGLMTWLITGVFMEGAWPYFMWTVGGFLVAGATVGFLLPKRAGEYFIQYLLGMLESGNI